jgi:hypothetical protein
VGSLVGVAGRMIGSFAVAEVVVAGKQKGGLDWNWEEGIHILAGVEVEEEENHSNLASFLDLVGEVASAGWTYFGAGKCLWRIAMRNYVHSRTCWHRGRRAGHWEEQVVEGRPYFADAEVEDLVESMVKVIGRKTVEVVVVDVTEGLN